MKTEKSSRTKGRQHPTSSQQTHKTSPEREFPGGSWLTLGLRTNKTPEVSPEANAVPVPHSVLHTCQEGAGPRGQDTNVLSQLEHAGNGCQGPGVISVFPGSSYLLSESRVAYQKGIFFSFSLPSHLNCLCFIYGDK